MCCRLAIAAGAWLLLARMAFAGASATDLVAAFSEGFELRKGRISLDGCGGGSGDDCTHWGPTAAAAHSGSLSAFFPDASKVSDSTLTQAVPVAIPPTATSATLTFWHRFDFETGGGHNYDGGILEIATNGSWLGAGQYIVAGGYNGIVNFGLGNPLGGVEGWVDSSNGWQQVVVDLLPFRGRDFLFRLRAGTDDSNIQPFDGWYVDDVEITYRAPLTSCAREWEEISPPPNQAVFTTAAAVGGRLYVFGGQNGGATAEAFRYSPDDDRWDPIAALPEPRQGVGAVSDGRSIYLVGGLTSLGLGAGTAWRYDPQENNYETLASFESGAFYPGATIADGVIYRTSGRLSGQDDTAVAQAYSIADDAWTPLAPYPTQLYAPAVLALNGYVFSAGGATRDDAGVAAAYRYDPHSDRWDDGPIADLPAPGGPASGAFYGGGWMVYAGSAPFSWDPAANTWRSLDQPPRLMTNASVAVAGDSLYVVGYIPDVGAGVLRYHETSCGGVCHGDCDGDGSVTVSDLVRGVNIALRVQDLGTCPSFDGNGDGDVTVNELIAAVGDALNGCGA